MPTQTQLLEQIVQDFKNEGWESAPLARLTAFLGANTGGANATLIRGGTRIAAYNDPRSALLAAADNDIIVLGPGTFALGSNILDLSLGGTGTVHLIGAGPGITIITSTSGIAQGVTEFNAVIHPGLTGCVIGNLTVSCTLTDGTFQAPIGASPSQSAFTNARVFNCKIIGKSDGIYLNNATACTWTFNNCEVETNFDSIAHIKVASGQAHVTELRNCKVSSIGPNTAGASGASTGRVRAYNCATGTIKLYNVTTVAQDGGATESMACKALTGGTILYYSGDITSTNSGAATAYDLNVASGSTITVGAGLVWDSTKVGGTGAISYFNFLGQAPGATFVASVSA